MEQVMRSTPLVEQPLDTLHHAHLLAARLPVGKVDFRQTELARGGQPEQRVAPHAAADVHADLPAVLHRVAKESGRVSGREVAVVDDAEPLGARVAAQRPEPGIEHADADAAALQCERIVTGTHHRADFARVGSGVFLSPTPQRIVDGLPDVGTAIRKQQCRCCGKCRKAPPQELRFAVVGRSVHRIHAFRRSGRGRCYST
jgi:hypothetical protein